jgi:hypothetical protein
MKNVKHFKICVIFVLALMLQTQYLTAQNLVPNPSFEECDTCPFGSCQIHFATGWRACSGSPDYFNICAFVEDFSVPCNAIGYQLPKEGNAYVNIGTFIPHIENGREYICAELNESLEIGRDYYISMYVSLINRAQYANNKIGVLFTNQINYLPPCYYEDENYELLIPPNYAHIYSNDIIVDTVNWTNISGWFNADSAYNYIMIGNFFDDLNTDILLLNYDVFEDACYYVDNVYVGKDSVFDFNNNEHSVSSNDINIYPNPAKDKITVNIYENYSEKIIQVRLYDLTGKDCTSLVMIEEQKKCSFIIIREKLNRGIYILEVKINNTKYVEKIIFY